MKFPEFNENGDLPISIYQATLQEVVEHFGNGSLQRQGFPIKIIFDVKSVKPLEYLIIEI